MGNGRWRATSKRGHRNKGKLTQHQYAAGPAGDHVQREHDNQRDQEPIGFAPRSIGFVKFATFGAFKFARIKGAFKVVLAVSTEAFRGVAESDRRIVPAPPCGDDRNDDGRANK